MSEILVKVTRGNQIESIHRGHIVVANAKGEILYHLGDPDFKICMRSCAKPIQALPVITTGAADKLKTYHHPVIKNHRKEIVGRIETQFTLTN